MFDVNYSITMPCNDDVDDADDEYTNLCLSSLLPALSIHIFHILTTTLHRLLQPLHTIFHALFPNPNPVYHSTSNEVLLSRRQEHPIIDIILDYRAVSKLIGTYDWRNWIYVREESNKLMNDNASDLDPHVSTSIGTSNNGGGDVKASSSYSYSNCHSHLMSSQLDLTDPGPRSSHSQQAYHSTVMKGSVHSNWNQFSTRTGRLSCSNPNLQQVSTSTQHHLLGSTIMSLAYRDQQ